jgi:GT2 family glycosyltransferase
MYHIIMNPDIAFKPEILNGLYDFMQQNSNVGLVMPKVIYQNGEMQYLCKKLPSPADLFIRRFFPGPLKACVKKILEAYELRHKDYNAIMEVPNLSGCFMFIRTAVFASVGLFDEQYFMYLEDTDLSRRINKYYRTVYYPLETITHGYRKASYRNIKLMKHHLESSVRYFNKWGWFNDRSRLFANKSINLSSFKPYTSGRLQLSNLPEEQYIISA